MHRKQRETIRRPRVIPTPARFRGAVVVAAAVLAIAACGTAVPPKPSAFPHASSLPQSSASVGPSVSSPGASSARSSPTAPNTKPTGASSPSAGATFGPGSWQAAGTLRGSSIDNGSLVALGDGGALLMRFGVDGRMAAERWDSATSSWRDARALDRPRTEFAAVTLDGNRVLVTGGSNQASQSYSSAYLYDAASDAWTKTGLMVAARTSPSAAVLHDGRVLVTGGFFYQQPDLGLGPSEALVTAYVPHGQPRPTHVPLNDVEVPPHGYALATAELFDPVTGMWSEASPMNFARTGAP